jgi:chemotaxis protein CheX
MASNKPAESLKLSAILDLNEASVLHDKLVSARGSDIVVDASDVERLGVQCAQVLVAAARSWAADGKSFLVENVSDAFDKTMRLIGIDGKDVIAKEIRA